MNMSSVWTVIAACMTALVVAVFTETGRALFAKLAGPVNRWRDRRKAAKADHASMPEMLRKALERTEKMAADRTAAEAALNEHKTRTTEQFEALHGEIKDLASHLSAQDTAAAADREVLADIFSMSQNQFENWAVAAFTCDADGNNTQVNAAWAELAGVDRADLMDRRWQRVIHPNDLLRHLEGFRRAREGHYEFDDVLIICPPDGPQRLVRVHMIPHPRNKGPAVRWSGTVVPLPEEG